VWNGEAPVAENLPSPPASAGHRPGLTSTISSKVAAGVEKAEEKYEHAKHILAEKAGHHRVPSINGPDITQEELDKAAAIDSIATTESLERPSSRLSVSSSSSSRPEPRVLHGWTLTSEISFRDVCKTIRETAFVRTDLPVIVSLEVHADLEQQEIMVDIMRDEWAGYLVEEPNPNCDPEARLPRLEELKNKILVKVKKAQQERLQPVPSNNSLTPTPSVDPGDSGQSGSEDERGGKKKKKSKIAEALGRLGIYTRSTHFSSFEQPEARAPSHIFSIGESQILDLHAAKQAELFTHNRSFFMRAYPAGRRIDSSNLDPSMFWRKGVQMAALNWQKWDEAMMLNEAMFAGEGGWVLKPPGYQSQEGAVNQVEAIAHMTLDLKIKIFAAQHIPLPHQEDKISGFHPYIKCELHVEKIEERSGQAIEGGGRSKEGAHKRQSSTLKGVEPDWRGEELSFEEIPDVVEQLSFVRSVKPISDMVSPHVRFHTIFTIGTLPKVAPRGSRIPATRLLKMFCSLLALAHHSGMVGSLQTLINLFKRACESSHI
jgi:phosphatidylinositol phospholipase C delta